jgi:RNA-binding protein
MPLTNPQKKKLKGLAHDLHPLVTIGQQGLKESIHDEMETALDFHQLIKVKIIADDRDNKKEIINLLSEKHQAEIVQAIGHMAIFYRRNNDKENLI